MKPSEAVAYARAARRLRASMGHNPARLHQALRGLTAEPAYLPRQLAIPGVDLGDGAARQFAAMVDAALEGRILRYSARQQLLRQSARMGIERFQANLIIAAIQHQAAIHNAPAVPLSTRRLPLADSRLGDIARKMLVVTLINVIIFFAAWLVFAN